MIHMIIHRDYLTVSSTDREDIAAMVKSFNAREDLGVIQHQLGRISGSVDVLYQFLYFMTAQGYVIMIA